MTTNPTPSGRAAPSLFLFDREPGWHFSLMLALQILFLFIAVPALGSGEMKRSVVSLLQLALAAIAITLVAQSAWLRLALALSFAATLLTRFVPGLLPQATTLAVSFGYNLFLTVMMARVVFGPGEVNHHRITGAIFIYLNTALLFALAFTGLCLFFPDSIAGVSPGEPMRLPEAVHLSLATLTTLGDRSVTPLSPFAKSLADLEAIVGHIFPAVLLSRLVGLHLSRDN